MNYKPTIGLEIHVAMNTKSKVFSTGAVSLSRAPNSLDNVYDLAFPGVLPVLNKQVVINAIQVCYALNMTIDKELHFDRKNYFYSDLPKGYQITQHVRPIGINGFLNISLKNVIEKVEIERLQIEEDTAKQIHFKNFTLVDYNRSGVPLIEIVTKPCIHSVEVAVKFIETIHEIITFLEISNGKMEEGQLRCDVNISLSGEDKKLGNKVEIKNINSFSYIKDALEFEIKRQESLLSNGSSIDQETRRYDEKNKVTKIMRKKNNEIDYKYFSECNIPPIILTDNFINDAIKSSKELASVKRYRYINSYNLTEYDANLLLSKKEISDFFESCVKLTNYYKDLANWININVLSYINKNKISFNELKLAPNALVSLINDIKNNNISRNLGYELFSYMIENGSSLLEAKTALHIFKQETNEEIIKKLVLETLNGNMKVVNDYLKGKQNAVYFLVGKTIQKNDKINPKITLKIMLEEIKKIKKNN
ncbi:MAG: Asp-tRNA(Asn)/Glu-tRNA(Gln) amidotransferase subunit GatB [Bacilli bacterium]|nr:Asp-tRNA(Asn)/Glu-tRNA(Gln) amidotransferase subunit GatB [Bacilli bacterium]